MSFIFKQMLNNINTDIEALQLEDINIGIGGAALGLGISNLQTALSSEITRASNAESSVMSSVISNINAIDSETIRSVAVDDAHAVEIATLRDEVDQLLLDQTVYAFQVSSTLNTNQMMTTGVIAQFNDIEYCTPANTFLTISFKYIVPKDGIYTFGFKCFINTVTTNFRLGIYQNNNMKVMGGAGSEATEGMDCVLKCNIGDTIHVACITGSVQIYMSQGHSWFYGHRIGNFV